MKQIEPWFEPTDSLRTSSDFNKNAMMSRNEHGFLSGLIKQLRPQKILEVGIGYGGTTSMILKTLELVGSECELFSIDLNSKYRGTDVGFMLKNVIPPHFVKHSIIIGKLLKDIIQQVGGNIDLVILDTSHNIPGEILEFLTVLPFMSEHGIVVLHDVALCNKMAIHKIKTGRALRKICPKILFTSVSGEKYYDFNGVDNTNISNIAAFKITDDTWNNIEDMFLSLSHLWYYGLTNEDIESYREYFSRHYSAECLRLWDLIIANMREYRGNMDGLVKYLTFRDTFYIKKRDLNSLKEKVKNKITYIIKNISLNRNQY